MEEKQEETKQETEKKPTFRDNLYGKITIPLKTLDKIIVGIILLLIFFIVLGIIL